MTCLCKTLLHFPSDSKVPQIFMCTSWGKGEAMRNWNWDSFKCSLSPFSSLRLFLLNGPVWTHSVLLGGTFHQQATSPVMQSVALEPPNRFLATSIFHSPQFYCPTLPPPPSSVVVELPILCLVMSRINETLSWNTPLFSTGYTNKLSRSRNAREIDCLHVWLNSELLIVWYRSGVT